ncbi:MAG: hypothetical protein HY457_02890 [Parcubacteria group bacterium]|nr:hypothetical protein [Parcubacteria group bacterium]
MRVTISGPDRTESEEVPDSPFESVLEASLLTLYGTDAQSVVVEIHGGRIVFEKQGDSVVVSGFDGDGNRFMFGLAGRTSVPADMRDPGGVNALLN